MATEEELGKAAHALQSQSATTLLAHRCMKLAMVHDVAEAIVGDITPTCGVSDEEKYELESHALQKMRGMLGGSLAGAPGGARDWVLAQWRAHLWHHACTVTLRTCSAHGAGEDIYELWHEYEQGQTAEARLVKDFDKVEPSTHAVASMQCLHKSWAALQTTRLFPPACSRSWR